MSQTSTPMTAEQELLWVHRKRQDFLNQLELKVMTDDKTPVSLLSLYRNTLRDHETACYKMMDGAGREPRPTANPVAPTTMPPKGKSVLTHCLAWVAALFVLFCSSAAQASTHTSQTFSSRAVCSSAGASPSHREVFVNDVMKSTTPSDTATTTPRTRPAWD